MSAVEVASPFAGPGLLAVTGETDSPAEFPSAGFPGAGFALVSPFAQGMTVASETAQDQLALEALVGELADEAFDESVQGLVDEAAARDLLSSSPWSSEQGRPGGEEVEAWAAQLAADADRLLEHLERELGERTPDTIGAGEVELAAGRSLVEDVPGAREQFLKALVGKVGRAVGGLAKLGLSALARLIPLKRLLGIFRSLVPTLVRRVAAKALNLVPPELRGPLTDVARRIGVPLPGAAPAVPGAAPAALGAAPAAAPPDLGDGAGSAPAEAEIFDRQLAEALLAPPETPLAQFTAEADHAAGEATDPLGALGVARERLAQQLLAAAPGEPPVAELEQFIPVVMAAMPLLRTATRVAGRDKIVGLLARPLGAFLAGYVGDKAATALARPLADTGLKLLSLEAEAPGGLGAEALVGAVEDTVRQVAALPPESLAEPLRVEAEVQEAFTEAAARHLPRAILRADLDVHETVGEGGVWVWMPRAARPCFRYRKYSRVYRVPVSRALARAVVFDGEDTLEDRLLDGGVRSWPVAAEVHLFEAVPGTHLGHLAAAEVLGGDPARTEGEVTAATAEFEDLTPEAAALLVGEPGLGRRPAWGTRNHRMHPGRRFFRIVVPGVPVRRRRRRIVVRLDTTATNPVLGVHLRLGEREAHRLAELLARRAHPTVVARIRGLLRPAVQRHLAGRLARHAARAGRALTAEQAQKLAGAVAEAMVATVAKELPPAAAALATAAKDPASGLTLSFTFRFSDAAAWAAGTVAAPTMTIRPGFHGD